MIQTVTVRVPQGDPEVHEHEDMNFTIITPIGALGVGANLPRRFDKVYAPGQWLTVTMSTPFDKRGDA